jgi:hypothetical protein
MLIHEALLAALHEQPPAVETDTGVPAPALAPTDCVDGLTE